MYRLTPQQFVNEMGAAAGWELIMNSDGEYQLGVKVEKDGEIVQTYLGPDPYDTDYMVLRKFAYQINAILITKTSDIDLDTSISRLNTDEFLKKIAAALEWTTVTRDGFVELLVLLPNGTMEQWLSKPYHNKNFPEAKAFIAMIERLYEERSS